jgi:23S rRNA pseudoU1915 N3-methylase RlmH
MRIHLISVGRRMPDWVEQGYREYAERSRAPVVAFDDQDGVP